MKQNNLITHQYNDVHNFIQSSLFIVLNQERIPSWNLLDFQSNEPINIEDLISKITDQVENNPHHYAQVYLNKDYDTYDIALTKFKSVQEYMNDEAYCEEDYRDNPTRTFIYEDTYHIRYQIDFVLSD